MKKQAESVLNSIERKQKEALDAGKTEGIPKEVIVRYTEARKAINEATEALKVYDSYDKKENHRVVLKKKQRGLINLKFK